MIFEKNFFLKLFLTLLLCMLPVFYLHPEMVVRYNPPEEKTIDIIQKEDLRPTQYWNHVVPKIMALEEGEGIVYLVPDYAVFKQLPQEGPVKAIVQVKEVNGRIKSGKILSIVQ